MCHGFDDLPLCQHKDDDRRHQHEHGGCHCHAGSRQTGRCCLLYHGGQCFQRFAEHQRTALNVPSRLEREDDDSHQCRLLVRHDHLPADAEHACSVYLCRFDHGIGHLCHGLPHQEQVHGGSDRGQDQCPVGIDHAHFCHDHILHDVDDVALIQQGNDDDRVDRLGTGEAYLCQTERRHCGEHHLTHGNGYGNKDAVEYITGERHPQVGTEPEHGTVVGQRGVDDVQLRREHKQFLHRLQGHDHCQINGQCHEQCQHQQKDENADSAAEYNALKEQYPDALVGFEQNGQFEFYGEDARKICELTGGKLLERETALGTVLVTGFPREQWVYRAKQLWECGENIYLAGLNEDGMHHQTKYLRREEYLPVGSIVHMEGREFRVDKVDFDKDSVTLQDMALAELRMPIFREAPLAVVRELYEQEPEPPVLVSDGLGLPGEDSNKLPVSIEVNEVPTTPEAAAAEEGLNEEGAPELAGNFRITDEELGAGGPKQKFARNIKAIKTLFTLEQEHRGATAEEQQVLSQYVGWGGLADAFDPDKNSWAKEYAELKGLLSEEEYKAARGSVLNAHYTSPTVIRAIYDAVERMGFRTGNILEPSMGVGNFFGMLPESMADSRLYGVELDSITGRIAQKLYPEANIKVAGFETTDRRDFYDLVVGNVPFGNYKVNDKAYNKLNFSIHNYFFAKAIDQVRPGGIVAFVTSRYTLDSKDSAARKHIAERADLLGAIRLPNNAFRANAGTDVVSDIIFLQKRDRPMDHEPAWVQLGKTADGIAINSYFADHPEMILGELTTESTQYGKEEATVVPIEGANLADQLREAVRQLEGQYLEAAAEVPDIAETEAERRTLPADPDVKNFSYPQGAGSAHRDRGGAGERTD